MQDIRNASSQVHSLQKALQAAHQETTTRDLQTLRAQEENNIIYMKLATNLQLSLESLAESDIVQLTERVERFDASLVCMQSPPRE